MRSAGASKRVAAALVVMLQPLSAQAVDERICDARGQCLSLLQSATYRQAQAHINIENWQEANDLLGQLYVQVLESESQLTFALVNNYALTLAQIGQPAVAALILEKYLKELDEIGVGFENLTRIYEYLADANEFGVTGGVDLLLVEASNRVESGGAAAVGELSPSVPTRSDELDETINPKGIEGTAAESTSVLVEPSLKAEITSRLERYFARWEAGDADGYLSFYTPGHSPDESLSYSQWALQRQSRVTPERQIRLAVSDLEMQRQRDGMIVTEYTQEYRSRSYSDISRKKLYWVKSADQSWTIWREVSLP